MKSLQMTVTDGHVSQKKLFICPTLELYPSPLWKITKDSNKQNSARPDTYYILFQSVWNNIPVNFRILNFFCFCKYK